MPDCDRAHRHTLFYPAATPFIWKRPSFSLTIPAGSTHPTNPIINIPNTVLDPG